MERVWFFRQLVEVPPPDLIRLAALHEGVVVGYVDLAGAEPHERELGFVIGDRSTWGRGLGRGAARAGCAHGFGVLGLRRIWAEAEATNAASIRVLELIGMREAEASERTSGALSTRRYLLDADAWSTRPRMIATRQGPGAR